MCGKCTFYCPVDARKVCGKEYTVDEVFSEIIKLDGVKVEGLMCMTPLGANENVLRTLFEEVRETRDALEEQFNCNMKELSMGMSQDYKIAAQTGATMLRIGRKLFG